MISDNIDNLKTKEILYIFTNTIDFELDSLDKNNLFSKDKNPMQKKQDPLSINKGYFYYLITSPSNQKTYSFIKSKKREKFFEKVNIFMANPEEKTLYLTGQSLIGKTATLIFYASMNHFHTFYINFKFIYNQTSENINKMLNYEIMRFFGSDYETENNNIKKIKDIINSFTVEKLQTILASISDLILDFYGSKEYKLFIFDEYIDNIGGFNLDNFLNYKNWIKILKL